MSLRFRVEQLSPNCWKAKLDLYPDYVGMGVDKEQAVGSLVCYLARQGLFAEVEPKPLASLAPTTAGDRP